MTRIIFAVALLLQSVVASAGDRSALPGVWRFVSEVDTRADGSPAPSEALSETHGFIVYTPDGFVSTVLMPTGRAWRTEGASVEEFRETVSNGTAYAGRYELDEAAHTLTHVTTVCMEPEYEGKRLVRRYALEGDTLRLTGTYSYHGEEIRFTVVWARVSKWRR